MIRVSVHSGGTTKVYEVASFIVETGCVVLSGATDVLSESTKLIERVVILDGVVEIRRVS